MLKSLRISSFALMESLEIELDSGLNALTGETGAGKSIIIQALSALLGEKLDETVIRTGADAAVVEGLFAVSAEMAAKLRQAGLDVTDELVIKRRIGRSKKSTAYMNNSLVAQNDLKTAGEQLVDLHGQHEHQSLLKVANHVDLLDSFAGLEADRRAFGSALQQYRMATRELDSATKGFDEVKNRTDLLAFQAAEIEKARIEPLEDEALRREKAQLDSAEKRKQLADQLSRLLGDDENSLLERLEPVLKGLPELVRLDPALDHLGSEVDKARAELDDVYRSVRSYRDHVDFAPEQLEQVVERLDLIARLKKKYGPTIEAVQGFARQAREELAAINNSEERVSALRARVAQARTEMAQRAAILSGKRTNAFAALTRAIEGQLKELGLEKARFTVVNRPEPDPGGFRVNDTGIDNIEFYIAPNPGEEPKPLRKIASGGEISRIMLALKTVLAENDQVPIMVFDEIDVGIGGKVAEALGKKLAHLGSMRQIICITHLSQIAKYADAHFLVSKEVRAHRTYTRIRRLDRPARTMEIARMLSGESITDKTIAHARELLNGKRR